MSPWSFYGREIELEAIDRALTNDAGSPSGAIVFADVGVGKTRVLKKAGERASARGTPVISLTCTRSTSTVPLLIAEYLLSESATGDIRTVFRRCAVEFDRPGQRAIARHLVIIDDAHLLDSASSALILRLTAAGMITVLMGVHRQVAPDASITALWKDEHIYRIDLEPFSREDVADVVSRRLDGPVDSRSARLLAEATEGNALYLRHLVDGARESGALHREFDVWVWDGRVEINEALSDVIGEQLRSLSEDERDALLLVALGEPIALDVSATLLGTAVLARLESAGLLRVKTEPEATTSLGGGATSDSTVRLAHPVYGEVMLARTGPLQRRHLLTSLADAHETRMSAEDPMNRTVYWRLEAGSRVNGDDLVRASFAASDGYDFARAEWLADNAMARSALGGRVALALALIGTRQFAAAADLLAAAGPRIRRFGDRELQRRQLKGQYLALYQGLGDDEQTERMLDGFSDDFDDLTRALRANILIDRGQLAAAEAATRPVLEATEPSVEALMIALENSAEATAQRGDTRQARALLQRLRALSKTQEAGVERAAVTALYQESMCLLLDGKLLAVVAGLENVYEEMLTQYDPVMRGLAGLILGAAFVRQGRLTVAKAHLLDSVAAMSEAQVGDALPWALALLCQAQAFAGEKTSAHATLADSQRLQLSRRTARCDRDFVLAEAAVAMVDGRLSDATRICLAGADHASEFLVHEADLLHSALRYGADPASIRSRLLRIEPRVQSPVVSRQAEYAAALANDDPDALVRVASAWAEDGALMWAAESCTHAVASYERTGNRAAAVFADQMSRELWGQCDGVDEHVRVAASLSVSLSQREREVVLLASEGLRNSEIADRLLLSVRTIESHLYNAFSKLGITRRAELPSLWLARR